MRTPPLRPIILALHLAASAALASARAQNPPPRPFPFQDPDRPLDARVADFIGRMTLEEKVGQLMNAAPAIERLGVPAYDWWNEALHGVARAGRATVFPQAIALAATWDTALMFRVATAISTEARAKYHEAQRQGRHGTYEGLTFWSPNINILRDPRWGRGMETYGEDPYLTGALAVAFVRGMQGDDPRYLRTVATPKHFAVHSGPEPERHGFDAVVSERDLRETYLPAFRAAVVEGGAQSVMCSYNRLDGVPACANDRLLGAVLRREWGFTGYVVTDCDAIYDLRVFHRATTDTAEAAAMALRGGTDLNCGDSYRSLTDAVRRGLVAEGAVDTALARLLRARFRLGMFDPPERVPYASIPFSANDAPAHRALALEAAHESIVLLKNVRALLPLRRTVRRIAVIGPDADDAEALVGNYNGTPAETVTPLAGIRRAVGPLTEVVYARGSPLVVADTGPTAAEAESHLRADAVAAARRAEVVVLCLGLSPRVEGEELRLSVPGFRGGDRTDIGLPAPQEALLRAVVATGRPVVLVLVNGGPVSVPWAAWHVGAIVEAWYGGQAAGTALADVLFGDVDPAGRLPATVYRSASQLPAFTDYRMNARTYRYFHGAPLFPFGHGLSYTRFRYRDLRVPARVPAGDSVEVSVEVRNAGDRAGEEVVQLYVGASDAAAAAPIRSLEGFRRVALERGERQRVTFRLAPDQLAVTDERGRRLARRGRFAISVGGKQPGFTGVADASTTRALTGRLVIVDPDR
jgi:beta-glucosidase